MYMIKYKVCIEILLKCGKYGDVLGGLKNEIFFGVFLFIMKIFELLCVLFVLLEWFLFLMILIDSINKVGWDLKWEEFIFDVLFFIIVLFLIFVVRFVFFVIVFFGNFIRLLLEL